MLVSLYALAVLTVALFLAAGIRLLTLARSTGLQNLGELEVDAARYRPMERLLSGEDDRFLSARGLDRRAVRRFRAERRLTFRHYLTSLSADFSTLAGLVRLTMVRSTVPRADLAKALFRARAVFAFALLAVEFRLALHALGVDTLTIDIRPLVAVLEQMSEQFQNTAEWSTATA